MRFIACQRRKKIGDSSRNPSGLHGHEHVLNRNISHARNSLVNLNFIKQSENQRTDVIMDTTVNCLSRFILQRAWPTMPVNLFILMCLHEQISEKTPCLSTLRYVIFRNT